MTQHLPKCCTFKNQVIITIIVLGALFVLIGCGQIYKKLGLTPDQAADQVAADQQATSAILDQTRTTTTEIITTIIAGLGATASGILAKWLNTERKITKALITGVESNPTGNVKKSIEAKATAAGVEDTLHARVLKYT